MAISLRKASVSVAALVSSIAALDRGVKAKGAESGVLTQLLRQFDQGMSVYVFSDISPVLSSAPDQAGVNASAEWIAMNTGWNSVKSNAPKRETPKGKILGYPRYGVNAGGQPVFFQAIPFRKAPTLATLREWYDSGMNFYNNATDSLMTWDEVAARVAANKEDLRGCVIVRTDTDVPQLSQSGTDQDEEESTETADAVTESGIPTV